MMGRIVAEGGRANAWPFSVSGLRVNTWRVILRLTPNHNTEISMYQIKEGKEKEHAHYTEINSDGSYGEAVLDYAKAWAESMETAISEGKAVADIAKELQPKGAGITGFQYGCVAQELSAFWVHGEEFRQWHNLDTQIQDEGEKANVSGGVLNPAIMNIG